MRFHPIHTNARITALLFGSLVALPALAEDDARQPAERIEKIEVVGSNIPRLEGEGPLPVTYIHRDEIERSGATRLSEVLAKLPYFGASNLTEASAPPSPYSGAASVSLRGLGTSDTLVLLNGRRIVNFGVATLGGNGNSFVNVNDLPLAAIDRVEVLRDGASAIYGADAIAGVINVVLRSDYLGAEAQATFGGASEGDRRSVYLATTGGTGDIAVDRFNVLASAEYQYYERLPFTSRSFSRSGDHRSQGGFDLRDPFGFPPTVHFPDRPPQAGPGCPPERTRFSAGQSECVIDYAAEEYLLPVVERYSAVLVANGNLAGGMRVFAQLLLGRTRTTDQSRPAGVSVVLPKDAPANPFAADIGLSWQPPNHGPRAEEVAIDLANVVTGLRGDAGGWDWEAAVGYGRSVSEYRGSNEFQLSKLQRALNEGALNPFVADNDPAALAAVTVSESDRFTSTQTFVNIKGTKELMQARHGPLALAVGFERARAVVSNALDPLLIVGDISNGLGAIEETHGRRDLRAFYAELNWRALRTLEMQLALRRDDYSDFGGATSPKLAVRWQPVDSFLARASAGTGFRAPTLFQTNAPRITFFDVIADRLRCPVTQSSDDCIREVPHALLGNPALQPERSRQYNLGFVWEPTVGLSAGLDLWRIDQNDKIMFGGEFILDHEAEFPGSVVRAPATAADKALGLPGPIVGFRDLYLNLAEASAKGIDLDVRRRLVGTAGQLTVGATASYQYTYNVRFTPDAPRINLMGTDGYPRTRATAMVLWQRDTWETSLTLNFIDSYRYREFVTGSDKKMASWTTIDGQLTWQLNNRDKLMLYVRNLTGRDPPFRADDPAGYDSFVHDPVGRFITLTWRHRFQ